MDNVLIIKVGSSISSDGFSVEIPEKFENKYNYGFNASHDRRLAEKNKPYTSDIIYDLMVRYNIEPENVHVTAGKNVFKGSVVSDENVKDFSNKYLSEVFKKFN